jgi:hypothetical protein
MELAWWHWIVGGIVLMLAELAVPAFFMVWFGLGAVVVGLVLLAVPSAALSAQIVVWTIASLVFVWLWFKIFKPNMFKTRAGMAKGQLVGEIGLATKPIRPFDRGEIRLQKPVAGSELWEALSEEEIAVGERVRVLDVEGHILKVRRAK